MIGVLQNLEIIPVVDVLAGQVVRAVGGRRGEYRPIQSTLTLSTDPLAVKRALLAATGGKTIYAADLDGIILGQPALPFQKPLWDLPCQWLLDLGLRSLEDARVLQPFRGFGPRPKLVLGTETLAGPEVIEEYRRQHSEFEYVLSVDLFEGRLRGNWKAWGVKDEMAVEELMGRAVDDLGIRECIVLDLARVGEGNGPGTEHLIATVKERQPELIPIAGGGVRGWEDCRRLAEAGAAGVLVSSALHDGRLLKVGDGNAESRKGSIGLRSND